MGPENGVTYRFHAAVPSQRAHSPRPDTHRRAGDPARRYVGVFIVETGGRVFLVDEFALGRLTDSTSKSSARTSSRSFSTVHWPAEAVNYVLNEITGVETPEPRKLRRAINMLRGNCQNSSSAMRQPSTPLSWGCPVSVRLREGRVSTTDPQTARSLAHVAEERLQGSPTDRGARTPSAPLRPSRATPRRRCDARQPKTFHRKIRWSRWLRRCGIVWACATETFEARSSNASHSTSDGGADSAGVRVGSGDYPGPAQTRYFAARANTTVPHA